MTSSLCHGNDAYHTRYDVPWRADGAAGRDLQLGATCLRDAGQVVWTCQQGTSRKFYTLSVERDLWGQRAIVRRWDQLDGTRVGVVVHWDPCSALPSSLARFTNAGAGTATSS